MTKLFRFLLSAALLVGLSWSLVPNQAHAQDPEFSQFYANPMHLNPAFAGTARGPRVVLANRNQWTSQAGHYETQAISYDQYFRSIKGGVGFNILNDQEGLNTFGTTRLTGAYAYQQSIGRELSLRMGLEASYRQRSLDWSGLSFGDMIDKVQGFIYETAETPRGDVVRTVDFGAGLLAFTEKFYFGVAGHHLNEPDESLVLGVSALPMKLTAHGGAKLVLQRSVKGPEAWISPNVLFRQQGEFTQLNVGLYVNKGPLVAGVWHRGYFSEDTRDALIVLLGVETTTMRFGYSYDITVSKLTPATGGTHEITLAMRFASPYRSKFRTVSCPTF